ncbi:hypothetical protein M1373_00525 [Candidatus Marsarchaeota archaeon]|nr:hypothetical protein [Candidatus Marsarchaeota archaeon]
MHVTLGQSTGTSWSNVTFFFVPTGTADPTTAGQVTTANYVIATLAGITSNDLSSGQSAAATFNLNGTPIYYSTAPGTSATGAIWVKYNVPSATALLSQIATTTLKES